MEPFPPSFPTGAPWVSPGDVVDAPRARPAPTIFDEPRRSGPALTASPVSRLQPRTVGQLLDGGFEVLRFRARTICIVGVVIILPLYAVPQALVAWSTGLGSDALEGMGTMFTPTGQPSSTFVSGVLLSYLAQLGLMLATMLMGVAMTHLVTGWLAGADPSPRETLVFVRSRLLVAIGAFVLALLLKSLGLVTCGLGLVYLVPSLSVLAPIVAAEGVGPGTAISRSFSLTKRRFWPVFGVVVLWAIASSIVASSAQGAAAVVGGLVTSSIDGVAIGVQVVTVVSTVVLTVVQVSVTVLLYIDLRVRTEGLDLDLEATERFGAVG